MYQYLGRYKVKQGFEEFGEFLVPMVLQVAMEQDKIIRG